jgi:hypothetical protein
MKKYTKKYKKELSSTHSKKEDVINWIKKLEKGELKDEVANYGSFSRIILEKILGYDYEENIIENVKEDYGRGLSEFALKKDNKNFMVIELKGSDSDLDKPQNRKNDKRTPVDQAFDYAKKSGDINWIFVSNYNEFRLYNWHKKQHQYISFKAEDLKDPETFKKFMLVFSKFSTIENNLIDKLVSKTIFVERDLEDEFYKLYNETRLMLIAEIEHLHSEFTREQSVHYSQLILNRYIFICFAEDLGLLPGEISVESIENPVKNNNLGRSEIWHRLNSLFIDVNEGNDFKKIYGYNGGLFNEDLEFLKIRDIVEDHSIFSDAYQKWKFEEYSLLVDEKLSPYSSKINPIYKNLMTISTFNFSSEVDVNILGHIFENSIGDIEELKADKKGRRKKDGIFYTPEYITDYICRNTIIPYLSKSGNVNTIKKLISEYSGSEIEKLDEKVKKIKIVDPACGSGAFLNKAGDILLKIHKAIHKEKYKDQMDTLAPFFDNIEMRREILLNNIYGVDINEESVEITKLSLFLKVCKRGLKLPNLDKNIQCGNSVVNDIVMAGDKHLDWKKSFSEVFINDGFDIVLGNPPYGVFTKKEKDYFRKVEKIPFKSGDSAELFCKKCFDDLLKPEGILGFIIPKKSLYGEPWESLRVDYWKKYDLIFLLDTSKSFTDVLLEASAYGLKKSNNGIKIRLSSLNENGINEFAYSDKNDLFLMKNSVQIYKMAFEELFNKISLKSHYNKVKVDMGTYIPKKFFIDQPTENKLLKGIDIGKWQIKTHRYLENTEEINWESAKKFLRPKVICQRIVAHIENPFPHIKITACYDDEGIIISHTLTSFKLDENLNQKFWLGYLNSKFTSWYAYNFIYSRAIRTMEIYNYYITQFPIPTAILENPEIQNDMIKEVNSMIELNQTLLIESNSFKAWIKHTFKIDKLSKKLENYYKLSFDEFLVELKKKKVDTNPRKTQEFLKKEFEISISKIRPLLQEIEETDNGIDKMVYELYGLTDDEIKIIEDSINS